MDIVSFQVLPDIDRRTIDEALAGALSRRRSPVRNSTSRFVAGALRWPAWALGMVLAIFAGALLAAAGWAWRMRWGGPWQPRPPAASCLRRGSR